MSEPFARSPAPAGQRLLLLRHGEVASHRGDRPVTAVGLATATEAGRQLGTSSTGRVLVLSAHTLRARQTARAIADGARGAGAVVDGPAECFALRNPDLYLAGDRVDLVSSAEAFAAQVPGLAPQAVLDVSFFREFLSVPDRIGFWLRSQNPPGDDAARVAERIAAFACSLGDAGPAGPDTVIAVTHSPVLRAVALALTGADPGEPPYLTGYVLQPAAEGTPSGEAFDPFAS
jgi:broad specificity phosphatase PhoE